MEWSNTYNPFNSLKALAWREHFEALAKGEIPPPVAVTIDPTNSCNLRCKWCKYDEWRYKNMKSAFAGDLLKLPDTIVKLGAEAVCIAGGGEPTLHPALPRLLANLKGRGLRVSIITNGTLISDELAEVIGATCDWVGVSMDAGCSDTWNKLKHPNMAVDFGTASNGIQRLVENGVQVGYKYLLCKENIAEVYEAASWAEKLGCAYFHARPVWMPNETFSKLDIETAWNEVKRARYDLEDESFAVVGVTHKFSSEWKADIPFKRCRVSSLGGTVFAADGHVYTCCDMRGEESTKLCSWDNVEVFWGSDFHKALMARVDTSKCPRCTYKEYGVILKEVFEKDKMNYHFI